MARLKGEVERAVPPLKPLPSPPLDNKIRATVEAMRNTGAPEADIEEFLSSQTV
jgi:hypothetical protein